MKTFALALGFFATVSALAQQAPEPTPPAPTPPAAPAPAASVSDEVQKALVESLPQRTAVSADKLADIRQQSIDRAPANQLPADPPPADAEVLELPKMTVKQQPRPRPRLNATDTKAIMLGPKAFNEELAKRNTTGLDRGLNRFNLGGQSAAERAREEYNIQQKRQFLDDVLTISKAAEQTDPANAKALREAAQRP